MSGERDRRRGNNDSENNKRRETRTENMRYMFVTELVSQPPMGWLKALAAYSATRDEWPCDVSVDVWREG